MMKMLPDEHTRKQALDPFQSFIVQAPAGSGKTELLIQRFLVLLAHAKKAPEEIIAITFTRKAASQMRQRVLDALAAAELPPPNEPHQRQTWELAQKAMAQSKAKQWMLLDNPHRLQIQTIDSLCAALTRRMPLLSGFGSNPNILEDPKDCYLQAAQRLIATLENEEAHTHSLAHLLLHLNNNVSLLETLFVDMLSKRDQWLPYLISYHHHSPQSFRSILENSLKHVILETLSKCHKEIPVYLQEELISLFRFSAQNLSDTDPDNFISSHKNLSAFPSPDIENHSTWLAISTLLLTENNTWRKTVNKNNGFPADNKKMKEQMLSLLETFNTNDVLYEHLIAIKTCPPATYTETQWQTIAALIELLPILAAELNVLFGEKNVSDFTQITLAAIQALGELESPSDLALILDYQIRHFLIDEFQDTSTTQFRLLMHLTRGWEKDDHRTLFLVGDPMQSIYRFREAEVGLFLKAQQEGIGNIALTSLFLTSNFRSTPTIVNWINTHFENIFPKNADMNSGAVSFNQSIPTKDHHEYSNVHIHPHINLNDKIKHIIHIIKKEQSEHPDHSIALLVRSRTHLIEIIPALKNAQLPFSAVEIESVKNQAVTHDLMALTTALLNLGDRAAWLSILRAPWCGLTLHDLYAIAGTNHRYPLWETLQNFQNNSNVSLDGKIRLKKMFSILSNSLNQKQRLPLRIWVEETWKALGGPDCLSNQHEFAIANVLFSILEEMDIGSDLIDIDALSQKLNGKFATPENTSTHALHIMTIHKAKGLEFDTVILPYLESKSQSESQRLLRWLDRPRSHGNNDLLLAPIKPKDEKEDLIYRYLHLAETKKIQHEMTRLLYVAVTRSKKNLHLLANISADSISKDSFLSLVNSCFEEKMSSLNFQKQNNLTQDAPIEIKEKCLRRLSLMEIEKSIFTPQESSSIHKNFHASNNDMNLTHKHIGTVTHRILQKITQTPLHEWTEQKINIEKCLWKKWLISLGVKLDELENSLDIITKMIHLTLNDPRGRWILEQRKDHASELAITTMLEGVATHFIIDRTFIDDLERRWIIDYKTSTLENENIESFLDKTQKEYNKQLSQYALAFEKIDSRPIYLGLYFPAFSGWREWCYSGKPQTENLIF